jgi:hypothetical protein
MNTFKINEWFAIDEKKNEYGATHAYCESSGHVFLQLKPYFAYAYQEKDQLPCLPYSSYVLVETKHVETSIIALSEGATVAFSARKTGNGNRSSPGKSVAEATNELLVLVAGKLPKHAMSFEFLHSIAVPEIPLPIAVRDFGLSKSLAEDPLDGGAQSDNDVFFDVQEKKTNGLKMK